MAFTYNDVQNLGSIKVEAAKGSSQQAFNTVTNTVKEQGTKAYEGVKGVMPVSNNKFGSLVDEVNANYNELDSRVWDLEFKMEMVAQWNGKELPNEEAMKEIRRRWEEKQAAEAKAKAEAAAKEKETEVAAHPGSLADVLADPRVLERLKALLFGTEQEVKEEVKKEVKEEGVAADIKAHLNDIKDPAIRAQLEAMIIGTPGPQKTFEEIVKFEDTAALDEYMEGNDVNYEELEKKHLGDIEKGTGIYAEKEKVEGEWKKCVSCGTDISVMYKPDTCPHCKRTAEAEAAKKTGSAPRPRIRFDQATK